MLNSASVMPTRQAVVNHPVLSRLAKEVEQEKTLSAMPGRYDRTHNRHNRGQ